jgi:hypothetical protein
MARLPVHPVAHNNRLAEGQPWLGTVPFYELVNGVAIAPLCVWTRQTVKKPRPTLPQGPATVERNFNRAPAIEYSLRRRPTVFVHTVNRYHRAAWSPVRPVDLAHTAFTELGGDAVVGDVERLGHGEVLQSSAPRNNVNRLTILPILRFIAEDLGREGSDVLEVER